QGQANQPNTLLSSQKTNTTTNQRPHKTPAGRWSRAGPLPADVKPYPPPARGAKPGGRDTGHFGSLTCQALAVAPPHRVPVTTRHASAIFPGDIPSHPDEAFGPPHETSPRGRTTRLTSYFASCPGASCLRAP